MKKLGINSPYTYALGMLAMMIPVQAFSSFYSYYYIDKLGLGVGLATLARTIYMVWDAVNDPILGYLSDGTRTRWGRRKPWIMAAIPLFMASFVFIFSAPQGMGDRQLFTWFLIALIVYESVAAILWVNYGALFPELFRGDRLRAKASAIQQGYQIVAILIGTALTPVIFAWIGFSGMAWIYASVFAVLMLLCMMTVQEDEEARKEPPLKMLAAFRETFKNKTFWIFNIANSFAQTVNGLLSSAIPFYAKYSLHIPESQVSVLLAAVFLSVIPLVAFWYWVVRKLGGLRGWRFALLVYALSVIPLWFAKGLGGGIAAGIVVGLGMSGFLVTPAVLNGQIVDRDYEKTGRRREGIYNAVGGFITRSSGLLSALAFWCVGLLFGYVSGNDPGPNADQAFRTLISVIPFLLLTISYLVSLLLEASDNPTRHTE